MTVTGFPHFTIMAQVQDELTLKELILAIRDYTRYFLRKWYWFVVGAAVVGGLFFYKSYTAPVTYTAPLTFLLNDNKDRSLSGGALLGNLGLGPTDPGGGVAAKLLELGKSRRVLQRVLFDSTTVAGETKMIADHLINVLNYHEAWEENEALAGFYYNGRIPAADDRTGNQVLKTLVRQLTMKEGGIMTVDLDLNTSVFTITANTASPELSIALVEKLYAQLTEYFITASVSDKQASVAQLTQRADSVRSALIGVEARLARFQDRSARIPLAQESVRGQTLQREAIILNSMYVEIIKNREAAAFLLANEKPGFELVDGPLEPLGARRENWKAKLIIGLTIGGLLAGGILFLNKLIRDTMRG